jgi:hypothetical protein
MKIDEWERQGRLLGSLRARLELAGQCLDAADRLHLADEDAWSELEKLAGALRVIVMQLIAERARAAGATLMVLDLAPDERGDDPR